jgi:hypothetical protein
MSSKYKDLIVDEDKKELLYNLLCQESESIKKSMEENKSDRDYQCALDGSLSTINWVSVMMIGREISNHTLQGGPIEKSNLSLKYKEQK